MSRETLPRRSRWVNTKPEGKEWVSNAYGKGADQTIARQPVPERWGKASKSLRKSL